MFRLFKGELVGTNYTKLLSMFQMSKWNIENSQVAVPMIQTRL